MKIYCGEFPVVAVLPLGGIKVQMAAEFTITIWLGDFPHHVKEGDRLPMYFEVPNETKSASIN